MAALRGSAKTRKSSRLSSPATAPKAEREHAIPIPTMEKTKNPSKMLDNWLEPPLRAPVPSFEDHRGLERMGVLEHLQPLGQPPTQRLLQKLKLAPPKPGRSTPVPNDELGTPTNGAEEMSIASPIEPRHESQSTDEVKRRPDSTPPIRGAKEIDDEYHPAASPSSTVARSKMASRRSVSIPPTPLPTGGYIYHGHYHPESIKQHVEAAVKRAESQSPELVPGLRKLCADSEVDPALWAVLDAVLNQSPSRHQYKTFHRYIRSGKREYSRNSTPAGQIISPACVAGHHHSTPAQRSGREVTTSTELAQLPATPASPSQSPQQAPQTPHSPLAQPVPAVQIQPSSQGSPPRPLPPKEVQMSSKQKGESDSSRISSPAESNRGAGMADAGANAAASQTATFQHELENLAGTPQKRPRSDSSSSSLSSAKSLDAETFAPTINQDAQTIGTKVTAKSALDQRQATTHKAGGTKRGPKVGLFSIFPNTNKANAHKQAGSDLDELELSRRKQRFQQNQGFHEEYDSQYHTGQSSERSTPVPAATRLATRSSTSIAAPIVHPHRITGVHGTLSSLPASSLPTDLDRGSRSGKKRPRDDSGLDEQTTQTSRSSPEVLPGHLTTDAVGVSRSDSPRNSRLPPAKRFKKSARVMVSPNKPKNGGVTAGVARAGPGRESTAVNGLDSSEEENNDYCGACGGNGELLCCDGCPNSFHFSCLDPPMRGPPEGSWYCVRCMARQPEASPQTMGMLDKLIVRSGDINPKAFGLPFGIRDYFDGIRAGEEGEYEDVGMPRTQTTDVKLNRAGFIEEPDYKKLRDAKGNIIICCRCRRTTNGKRDIIPCDYCPNRWHLDCLDPPLAVPPRRRNGDKPNATWRCPLHIDEDLRSLGNGEGHALRRQPRHRVPKNPIPRDVSMSQGFRNHGVIDVKLMEDDERIDEIDMQGTVYRLPERGIRLDFLDRIRRTSARYEEAAARQQYGYATQTGISPTVNSSPNGNRTRATNSSAKLEPVIRQGSSVAAVNKSSAVNSTLRARTLREQQAVLSLQLLAQQDENLSNVVAKNQIADLTNQLGFGADEGMMTHLVAQEELQQLQKLRSLIDIRISVLKRGDSIAYHERQNGNCDSKPVVTNGDDGSATTAAATTRRNSEPPGSPSPRSSTPLLSAKGDARSATKSAKPHSASTSKTREERRVSRGRQ